MGPITALTFVLTLDDPARFANSRDVGCFLGLRPKSRQSGASEPEMRISKEGDGYLRTLLVQCAQYILSRRGPETDLKRWGLQIAAKGKKKAKKRAVVAVARKLAVWVVTIARSIHLEQWYPPSITAPAVGKRGGL